MARFYVNGELRDWIILFSKLAFLPCKDVPSGFHALIREYEGMVHNRIASDADDQRVTAFFKYIRTTYIHRGDDAQPRKPLYSIDLWNVNQHIVKQRPVTNNAVEAWNKEYKSHFPGGGKPDRSKVIRHQMDEQEAVRHAIIRLLFKFQPASDDELLAFLRSIQDSLCYPKGANPDIDEFEEDEEDEENILYLMPDINVLSIFD
uniref:MULE transposase domain-containing protein n=1 Tax=Ditylenchus dipsaci TaxID=166011 RepID=A0A915E957_9BILA